MEVKDTKDVKWAPVLGYEKEYLVSTDGRVYSIRNKKCLKPRIHSAGYQRVLLCKNGTPKDAYIHRLMCEAFYGIPTDGRNYVNHLDENKTHNQITNLEWTTNSKNVKYSWDLHKQERIDYYKENPPAAIAIVGYRKKTKQKVGQWKSMSEAARQLKVHVSNISRSVKSKGKNSVKGILFFKIQKEEQK